MAGDRNCGLKPGAFTDPRKKKRTSGAQLTGKPVFFGKESCESEILEKMAQVREDATVSN